MARITDLCAEEFGTSCEGVGTAGMGKGRGKWSAVELELDGWREGEKEWLSGWGSFVHCTA